MLLIIAYNSQFPSSFTLLLLSVSHYGFLQGHKVHSVLCQNGHLIQNVICERRAHKHNHNILLVNFHSNKWQKYIPYVAMLCTSSLQCVGPVDQVSRNVNGHRSVIDVITCCQ